MVCSVVVVLVRPPPQPLSIALPARIATPSVRRKRFIVLIITFILKNGTDPGIVSVSSRGRFVPHGKVNKTHQFQVCTTWRLVRSMMTG